MKTEEIVGLFFILTVVASICLIFVPQATTQKQEIITVGGKEEIKNAIIHVQTGVVVLKINETFSGWFINGTYSGEGMYNISKDGSCLTIYFEVAILKITLGKSVKDVDVTIDNGNLDCVINIENISLEINIGNGNADMICVAKNFGLSASITNGNFESNLVVDNLTGILKITNGNADISGILGGGKISYDITNGNANVLSTRFEHRYEKTKNGERGELISEGPSNFTISINDGDLNLLIVRK